MRLGIASMHYVSMHALLMEPAIHYEPAIAVVPSAFVILIVTLLLFHLDARVTFLANSVAQLNEQVDRMRGLTR